MLRCGGGVARTRRITQAELKIRGVERTAVRQGQQSENCVVVRVQSMKLGRGLRV